MAKVAKKQDQKEAGNPPTKLKGPKAIQTKGAENETDEKQLFVSTVLWMQRSTIDSSNGLNAFVIRVQFSTQDDGIKDWWTLIDEENDEDSEETRPERSREPTKEAERTESNTDEGAENETDE